MFLLPLEVSLLINSDCSATAGGLDTIAKLDAMVTVLCVPLLHEVFDMVQLLHDWFQSEMEDERTVTDLMIDQIEFADVNVVDKVLF